MTFSWMNAVAPLIVYAFAFHNNVGYIVIVVLETRSKLHKLILVGSSSSASIETLTLGMNRKTHQSFIKGVVSGKRMNQLKKLRSNSHLSLQMCNSIWICLCKYETRNSSVKCTYVWIMNGITFRWCLGKRPYGKCSLTKRTLHNTKAS